MEGGNKSGRTTAPEAKRSPVLPANYLRSCLLLLLLEGTAHGYQLAERVGELGLGGADRGGVYRALRGMEEDGLVISRWEESSGTPPRRTYETTPAGFDELTQGADSLRQALGHISGFLARFQAADDPQRDVAA